MREQSLGELLREARVRRQITLDDIENSTGISSHYLLAMELDQFKIIPEEKFDTFLRQYADIVGLDFLYLKERYRKQSLKKTNLSEPTVTQLVEEKLSRKKQENKAYCPPPFPIPTPPPTTSAPSSTYLFNEHFKNESDNDDYEQEVSRLSKYKVEDKKSKSFFSILLLSLIALTILSFIFFAVWQQFSKENKANEARSEFVNKTADKKSSSTTSSEKKTKIVTEGQDNYLKATITKASDTVEVTVSLTDAESAWISLTNSDIGEAGITLTKDNPTYTATLPAEISEALLTLGVKEGVSVTIDGQPLDLSALTSPDVSYITLEMIR
ncbi:helix-turn-helix domain-containing protein [Streptococcus catagoni]|uniref:helix-turn-helix domain-containing protein n=1 Tax=Streptococcus catagoni TaxID=2654874 RepID=UPI00140B6E88|nr:helix-turn-helix domain-containing protein [Streptococcus catagoni]